jgi:hypothetical protein
MQRYGGRAMFGQTAALTLAAWLACAAAERAVGEGGGGDDEGDGPEVRPADGGRGRSGGLAEHVRRLLAAVGLRRGAEGGGGGSGALARVKYAELKSKDSGPDLARLQGGGGGNVGDEITRLRSAELV